MKILIPGKVVMLGEWAVLDGYPALGASVDRYFRGELMPAVSAPSTRDDFSIQLSTHNDLGELIAHTWNSSSAVSTHTFWIKSSKMLHYLCNKFSLHGQWNLSIKRDWPVAAGLGSSSALALTLMLVARHISQLNPLDELSLFKETRDMLHHVEETPGSGIDIATQIWGSLIRFQKQGADLAQKFSAALPPELVLIHLGDKIDTSEWIKKGAVSTSVRMQLGASSEKFFKSGDWLCAIEEHYQALSTTDLVPRHINEIRHELLQSNLITALKTTGAGGGDALLLWADPLRHTALKLWAQKHGFEFSEAKLGVAGMQVST